MRQVRKKIEAPRLVVGRAYRLTGTLNGAAIRYYLGQPENVMWHCFARIPGGPITNRLDDHMVPRRVSEVSDGR